MCIRDREKVSALAEKKQVNIVLGCTLDDGGRRNASILATRDGKVHRYYKVHLSKVKITWQPGYPKHTSACPSLITNQSNCDSSRKEPAFDF